MAAFEFDCEHPALAAFMNQNTVLVAGTERLFVGREDGVLDFENRAPLVALALMVFLYRDFVAHQHFGERCFSKSVHGLQPLQIFASPLFGANQPATATVETSVASHDVETVLP